MKKVSLVISFLFATLHVQGASPFTLSFTTVDYGSNPNILAGYITQGSTYINTIGVYGANNSYISHLSSWRSASAIANYASVDADAYMGATRSTFNSPNPVVFVWDLKNKNGADVADGTYTVNLEIANESQGTHFASFSFVKDGVAGTRNVANSTYFTGISIAYVPPAAANTAPVANSQSVTNAEDTAKAITLTATDAESNTLTYAIATSPSHGTLSGITATNQVTYTPATNYYGADSFTFRASDASLTSTPATVSITVTPVNDPPVAQAQSIFTAEDTAKLITLVATDVETNALTYAIVIAPSHGTLGAVSSNTVTYTPATNYYGADSFTFKANDGLTDSVPATVSITVTPVNDPPVAQAQSVSTAEDTAKVITLVATDVETNALTYAVVTPPSFGTLGAISSNTITYTPATNYNGSDSFTFRASDGVSTGNTATVSITVTPVNDPPVALAQSQSAIDGNAVAITLSATDAETNALTYNLVSLPVNGHLLGTPPALTYVPVRGLNGSDSFSFNAFDGTATGSTATVSISLVFIDSSSNGIPNSWKSAYGVTDANADPDGDGASNYAEYMAGTDPTNKASVFAVNVPQTGTSNVVIKWNSVQYRYYTVQSATNLIAGWNTLISNNLATPPQNSYTGTYNQAGSTFYRIKLEP
jgi:VCBS repeat-containing protein